MVQIRLASIEDKEVIADFQIKMAQETENLKLDSKTVSLGVRSVFLDPAKGKYLVAVEDFCSSGYVIRKQRAGDFKSPNLQS